MNQSFSVKVEHLSKRYRIGERGLRSESLGQALARQIISPVRNLRDLRRLHRFGGEDESNILWALRDVSFDLQHGDVLGVIGRNGAGKSTLLKLLSRITDPTEGRAFLSGRVVSLLEVGTGFHQDLTGRENVFLNGSMLGMRRHEILSRFDEIVEFSGIEQFIDTPVKRYSSGMYVRLAFAVAAHVDPDVLIADEVLAVGDSEFQQKCLGKMREAASGGRTIIFVSHNQTAVASLCSRAIWLDHGSVQMDGEVGEVTSRYLDAAASHTGGDLSSRTDRIGSGALRFVRAELRDARGVPSLVLVSGEPATLVVDYTAPADLTGVTLELSIISSGGRISTLASQSAGHEPARLGRNGRITCRLEALPLNGGNYSWALRANAGGRLADWITDVLPFAVDASTFYPGDYLPPARSGPLLLNSSWMIE
jgi:lipopolysaccharide transport system ATP-binding protein